MCGNRGTGRGNTEHGCGYRGTGKKGPKKTQHGCLDTGKRKEEAGSGCRGIGNSENDCKAEQLAFLHLLSSIFRLLSSLCLRYNVSRSEEGARDLHRVGRKIRF